MKTSDNNKTLQDFARAMHAAGFALYRVGGCVRDKLLSLPQHDVDVTGAMLPDAVLALCAAQGIKAVPINERLGTVELHLCAESVNTVELQLNSERPDTAELRPRGTTEQHLCAECMNTAELRLSGERVGTAELPLLGGNADAVELHLNNVRVEYTTFRTESYGTGGTHSPAEVAFTTSLEADAFRRDFSVNALYEDVLTGEILDPTGGRADLARRVLRTTTADPALILRDDGLRILRLVRFCAQLDFTPEERTWAAAKQHAPLLADIARERKRQELSRILLGERVLTGLRLLRDVGALPYVLPELAAAENFPQNPQYHKYDVLEHSFHTCAAIAPALPLRLIALLHDVGKPASFTENGNMHEHPRIGEGLCRTALTRLTYEKELIERVCFAVAHHMFDLNAQAKITTVRRRFALWGRESAKDFIAIRQADVRGSGRDTNFCAARWQTILDDMEAEQTPFSPNELALSGRDIMEALHLPPGKEIGQIKERLFLHCAARPADNTREKLLELLTDAR